MILKAKLVLTRTLNFVFLVSFGLLKRILKGFFSLLFFPFRSIKNLLKTFLWSVVICYGVFSFIIMDDYIKTEYSTWDNYFCAIKDTSTISDKVVRVVGGYTEGSGFFITPNQVITNFHVIDYEPSPKIILANGDFITPIDIKGDKDADIAVLTVDGDYSDQVIPLTDRVEFNRNERAWAIGYPLGTDLTGNASVISGNLIDLRQSEHLPVAYIQTNISLVEGMSGGPLVNVCGQLLGINTQGLAGLSLFILGPEASSLLPTLSSDQITKIEVNPSESPKDAVFAFYTYLKARRMEDGFSLLSRKYLEKTNFEEWTNRFTDILDVTVYYTTAASEASDTAFVKFSTKNWVNDNVEIHYYQGTWSTVQEDGLYKMLDSEIEEVDNPDWSWFYEPTE